MKKHLLCIFFLWSLLLAAPFAYSQNVSFSTAGTAPNASAVIDLSNCTNGGFLVPNMTSTVLASGGALYTLPATTNSMLVFTTDAGANCFWAYYSGSGKWNKEYCLCSGAPSTPGAITSSATSFASGSTQTYSVTAVSGATSYTWTLPTGGVILTGTNTNSITASMGCSSGNVTVTATNNCGTSAAQTVAISTPTSPAITASNDTTICAGVSIPLVCGGAGSAGTYTWSPSATLSPSTGSSITATPTTTVTYTITATVAGTGTHCSSTSQNVVVTVHSLPTITASASPTSMCAGAVTTLTGGGAGTGGTYSWTPIDSITSPTSGSTTANPTITTTFTVVGTNSLSCSSSATVKVTITSSFTVSVVASPTTGCTSATLTASGATSYTWAPSTSLNKTTGTTVTATPSSSRTYTVTGTSAGCTQKAAITVQPALTTPTVTGTQTITASTSGNTFSVPAVTGATYVWTVPTQVGTVTAGAGTNSITLTAAGTPESTYSISVQETNPCGSVTSANYKVTLTACSNPVITSDANNESGVGTNHFIITTSSSNDLVIVSCHGYNSSTNPVNFTGSVAITGAATLAATQYDTYSIKDAEIAIYYFVAPTPGTYTITVTETGYTEYDNFGVALTGFCGVPSSADFVHTATNNSTCDGSCYTLSKSLTESASAGSYAIGLYTDFWKTTGDVEWSNEGGDFSLIDNNTSGHDDYSMAGQTVNSSGSPTIQVTEGGSAYIDYAVLYLIDIQ